MSPTKISEIIHSFRSHFRINRPQGVIRESLTDIAFVHSGVCCTYFQKKRMLGPKKVRRVVVTPERLNVWASLRLVLDSLRSCSLVYDWNWLCQSRVAINRVSLWLVLSFASVVRITLSGRCRLPCQQNTEAWVLLIFVCVCVCVCVYYVESISKSFRTGRLERELQMVEFSAPRCNFTAILWVSLVSFAAITLCVASQRVFIVVSVYFVMTVWKLLDTPSYVCMYVCMYVCYQDHIYGFVPARKLRVNHSPV
jgi:hypothetical protein